MATTKENLAVTGGSGDLRFKEVRPVEAVPATSPPSKPTGRTFDRHFTDPAVSPYDAMAWEIRDAVISNEKGETVFCQNGVEVPATWSQMATNIVASKYFHGTLGTAQREGSARQLIGRVVDTMTRWGSERGYFASERDAEVFHDELTFLLLNQYASFNSPVWFNAGIEPKPQCSACFINSVEDTMGSILDLAKTEGMLFKWGSGTGTNLSPLRSSRELLSGGGIASGPVSFMKGYDAFAGVIRSGGKTRRAAKMVILNVDHPDIIDFIESKEREEKKAWALIDSGYDGSFNGEAYASIFYQNANHSVRVTDDFMQAVAEDREWLTPAVTNGEPLGRYRARDILRKIAQATHVCGDPGMQFDTTVNRWHTSKATARINASNPCVTGDTLVATADGWRRIDSLVGRSARVIGADGQPHLVNRFFPTGTKPVFRLRTRAGYEVRITGDHRVWTLERGDVPVSELQIGEKIQLQGAGFGRAALAERLALGIGVAVGDGCLTRSHASGRTQEIVILTMAAEESGILQAIAGVVNQEKRALRVAGAGGRADDVHVRIPVKGSVSRLSFSSQPVVNLFKEFAVLDQGSDGKRFTPAVFDLDKPSMAALLRGLFTADGTVANYNDKSQYVSLDSTSLPLLQQVQLLLLGFGIKAKLYEGRRGGVVESTLPNGRGGESSYRVKEVYSLRISRSSRLIFEREIGFDPTSSKAGRLSVLNDAIAAYHDELADEVCSIEPLGEEPVYDLTEEATHHFVANGLLVHNCSEYMFLDDSACNLASLNLMKFVTAAGRFDVEGFRRAVDVVITAQEIIVDNASYPTERIARNSHDYRPLGLGYANLGALLMYQGIPYDSDTGRDTAAAITAVMTGQAYLSSALLAGKLGPFAGFAKNRDSMLEVIDMHRRAAERIDPSRVQADLFLGAREVWEKALEAGRQHGYKNAQASVLAPTGTIGLMMDCDTTGVEPDLALVKFKKLVGGGMMKIVNQTVGAALKRLGYADGEVKDIVGHIETHGFIEGAPHLKDEHLPVFDCAVTAPGSSRSIHYMGHVRMMAAVQPFLSGAISKTVNMPQEATVEEIMQAYVEAWKLGLKAIAIYRDGSKRTQPLNTIGGPGAPPPGPDGLKAVAAKSAESNSAAEPSQPVKPVQRKLPVERNALTHKFSIAGHEGYITVGMYKDGSPGEIFINMSKEGSTVSGLMDAFARAISYALQYGVPLEVLVDKFTHTRFEPSGFTGNSAIPYAKSITDYIFRWLALKFLPPEKRMEVGLQPGKPNEAEIASMAGADVRPATTPASTPYVPYGDDAPPCSVCGSIMVRNGSCYKCLNCGTTSGCS